MPRKSAYTQGELTLLLEIGQGPETWREKAEFFNRQLGKNRPTRTSEGLKQRWRELVWEQKKKDIERVLPTATESVPLLPDGGKVDEVMVHENPFLASYCSAKEQIQKQNKAAPWTMSQNLGLGISGVPSLESNDNGNAISWEPIISDAHGDAWASEWGLAGGEGGSLSPWKF